MNANDIIPSKRILIVDDTPTNLRLLASLLSDQGYDVRLAPSGSLALAVVQQNPPNLILLDVRMPRMDGYEVCRRLKASDRTRDIPIIFISALDDTDDKVRAFAVGGVDYICKPFQEAEVLARVRNQLNLRELQSQLEQQNQELMRTNEELEQFVHVVSHDLQQPLQSIVGYAKITRLRYSDLLETAADRYLRNIITSGERMQQIINDLLSYAGLTHLATPTSAVDCNVLLADSLNNLSALIEETDADIVYAELPTIQGSEIQLLQLFQNLISNAIKFTEAGVSPLISIEASWEPDGHWIFRVQDNGIGIPAEHVQSIFRKFYRLHSARQYSGTGLGLAICQRIVDNHSGQIWVESTLGEGSSFYIKLPGEPA